MRTPSRLAAAALVAGALLSAAAAPAATDSTSEASVTQENEPVRPAFGDESAPLRPGASLPGCTFNWIYHETVIPTEENPNPVPKVYVGTAAHCTDTVGETITLEGFGAVGTLVYDSDDYASLVDFSLIELYPGMEAFTNPKMLGWDGPYGVIGADELAVGDQVDLHGYGMVLGDNPYTRDRFGLLTTWTDKEYVVNMPAVYGDSGGPFLHDATGMALGIVSRFGFVESPPSTDRGPLMSFIFSELAAAGFDNIELSVVE